MKVYVAGPMRGYPEYNFPAFDRARDDLIAAGHEPVSPADMDRSLGFEVTDDFTQDDWHNAMRRDVAIIANECDAIALLPGWEESRGANAEKFVAETIGLDVYFLQPTSEGFALSETAAKTIVGLSGYARTGKDTIAALAAPHGFRRLSVADRIRDFVFAVNPEVVLGRRRSMPVQYLVRRLGWEAAKDRIGDVRRLLQRSGAAARAIMGEDVWVDATYGSLPDANRILVTDVRFPNEADAIRARGGIVVRVHRPGFGPANDHLSEVAMDEYDFDEHLHNDGSLDDLEKKVSSAVERWAA